MMSSFNLGEDVYLEFKVKVSNRPALISHCSGELYRNDKYIGEFRVLNAGGTVSGLLESNRFTTIGDYVAKFSVWLDGMGKQEHAVPFKITKSVLGKKRLTGGQ